MSEEKLTLEDFEYARRKLREADVKSPYYIVLPNSEREEVDSAIADGAPWRVIQEHENHFVVAVEEV